MVEKAKYIGKKTFEGNDEMDANEAHIHYLHSEIENNDEFICKYCDVQLTCVNLFKNDKNARRYFRISHLNNSHSYDCPLITKHKISKKIDDELKYAHNTINEDKPIILSKVRKKVVNNTDTEQNNKNDNVNLGPRVSKKNKKSNSGKVEHHSKHYSLLQTFISLYNENPRIRVSINGNVMTLDEFFVDSEAKIVNNLRIFKGEATISKYEKNTNILKIVFDGMKNSPIFSNIKYLTKRLNNKKMLNKYIRSGAKIRVYFRGIKHSVNNETNFENYNSTDSSKKVYLDLYFEELK